MAHTLSLSAQAIKLFSEALSGQELELKGVCSRAAGARKEVERYQERHDHLTTVEQRIDRICANKKSQIRQTEELIQTTKQDLEKATRAKQGTAKTLQATEEEVKRVDKEIADTQVKVQLLDRDRKILEDQVLLLLREQVTAEKSGEYTDRIVRGLREQVDKLEARMAQVQDQMADAAQVSFTREFMRRNF